jgi:hypothetical protein
VRFSATSLHPVQDVYSFTVAPGVYWISLEPATPGHNHTGDLDLYLFFSNAGAVVPVSQVPRFSLTSTSHELIGVRFGAAGTFLIGVSAFEGNVKYKLRVLPEPPI